MKLMRSPHRLLWGALPALVLAATPATGAATLHSGGSKSLPHSPFNLLASQVRPEFAFDTGGRSTPSAPRGVDLDCSVVNWNTSDDKPILTLTCPAQKRPTPFRVYIRLSWMGSNDRPNDYRSILAPPRTTAKFHSDARGAYVWLRLQDQCRGGTREDWVKFSELVCLEMVREPVGATQACSRKDELLNEEFDR